MTGLDASRPALVPLPPTARWRRRSFHFH